jgi:hypothetical protein
MWLRTYKAWKTLSANLVQHPLLNLEEWLGSNIWLADTNPGIGPAFSKMQVAYLFRAGLQRIGDV